MRWPLTLAGSLGVVALALASPGASVQSAEPQAIRVGGGPTGIAFARGAAWVVTTGALVELDGATGAVKRRIAIPPGGDYQHIAIAGREAWVTDGGGPRASILAVDLSTRRIRHVTRLLCCAIGVATQGSDVWVTVPRDGPGLAVRINARTGRILARVVVGPGPGPIAIAGRRVWVWNTSAPTSLMGIDPATNRVVTTISLPGVSDIAAGPAGLWASEFGAGILRLDPASGRVVHTTPAAPGAQQLVVGRSAVYAAGTRCEGCSASYVTRVDVAGGRAGRAVRAGDTTVDLALGGGAVWAANFTSGTVTRIPITRG